MVRLVFRPYTHVRRTICTSVSLRTSIRVSPAFILHKHSSPSFGSQLISSCSTFHKRSDAAGDAPVKGLSSRFLCTLWFSTIEFAHKLDSLVRVSRRVGTVHKGLVLGDAQPRPPEQTGQLSIRGSREDKPARATGEESVPFPHSRQLHHERHSSTTRGQLPSRTVFWSNQKPTSRPRAVRASLNVGKRTTTDATGSSRFTLNGFTYYFTFFSKFFSSFPHGTCSLSVSNEYLALGDMHLPLCTAVPSNTTLGTSTVTGVSQKRNGAIILYGPLSQ